MFGSCVIGVVFGKGSEQVDTEERGGDLRGA